MNNDRQFTVKINTKHMDTEPLANFNKGTKKAIRLVINCNNYIVCSEKTPPLFSNIIDRKFNKCK